MSEHIYTTRREFITGGIATLSLSSSMPAFLVNTVEALAAETRARGRVLVILQLAGGNDGLNTVVPYADDAYYRARPRLAIQAGECLKLDDHVGLHPALNGLQRLFDAGQLSIVQGVGYPNPNRSHFRSMDIWHTADSRGAAHSGWMGRYFDSCCAGEDPPDPAAAVALMPESPLALAGRAFSPLAFEDPEKLRWRSKHAGPRTIELFEKFNGTPPEDEQNTTLDFLRRAALDARMGADDVHRAARGLELDGRRGSLAHKLGLVARMILEDFPTTVYYVSFGGFDTHANQSGRHQRLMNELGNAVSGFIDTLTRHKVLDRIMLMSFSEFGRRVRENASGGTDHGAAAPMFLVGGQVNAGVHLKHPSLEQLDQGDLIHGCDFRRVYATVLRDWFQVKNPQAVLGGRYQPLPLIR